MLVVIAGVAQLAAQTTCNRQVVGSSPTTGSVRRATAVSRRGREVLLSRLGPERRVLAPIPGRASRQRVWALDLPAIDSVSRTDWTARKLYSGRWQTASTLFPSGSRTNAP